MAAKLDKTRDFGEVSGDTEDGTRYFQDDKRFDVNGDEITAPKKAKEKPVPSDLAPAATTVDTPAAEAPVAADAPAEAQPAATEAV